MIVLRKIISGGQTGVDIAALKVAIDLRLEHGGWCPPGRVCDEGIIPDTYQLKETPVERSPDANEIPRSLRTAWNVRDSDASLVLFKDKLTNDPGSQWTMNLAKKLQKPLLICDLTTPHIDQVIIEWLSNNPIHVLNVAGPMERESPGIGDLTYSLIKQIFSSSNF